VQHLRGACGSGELKKMSWKARQSNYVQDRPSSDAHDAVVIATNGNVFVADNGNDRVEEFNEKGEYQGQFGTKGSGAGQFEFSYPIGLAFNSSGDVWVTDPKAETIEKWLPPSTSPATGNKGAYDSQTVYYSPKTESGVAECENHPEWANLPCQTQPAHQPEITGLPELPVTVYKYNMWDEPEITKTTSGSAARTETDNYEPTSGRVTSKEITSTTGESLPKVSYTYSASTGALVKQSTGSGESEKKIEDTYNDLGELTAYTDATGTTSTYKYNIDGQDTESNDGKGTQHYEYSETTGLLSKLTDSSNEAMKFTTGYDAEGNLTSEGYPNGMTATTTYNPAGEATDLEYTKTTHCTEEEKEKCKWFKDTIVPSIHGQWMSQTSTLANNSYAYDEAGRLIEAQETPAGKHCKTRTYKYDEDGNRLSLTKHESSTETCNNENATEEQHSYDTADRLLDTGTEYNPFGDITKLSGTDAGGEPLTSRYYADGQLSEQEQHHETIGYKLDPARRTLETVSTGEAASDTTNHYSGEGTDLVGGVGIAANAVMPPPVNAEIEATFQANPPWDQVTAGTEEYEEYWEEEGEEGEEFISWDSENAFGKGVLSEGVLFRALPEGQEYEKPTGLMPKCDRSRGNGPCEQEICTFDRGLGASVSHRGSYTYIQVCGAHGKHAGRTVGYIRLYTPTPSSSCTVHFAGAVSTCQQVLNRARARGTE
jgi:YD repeat-containing protein